MYIPACLMVRPKQEMRQTQSSLSNQSCRVGFNPRLAPTLARQQITSSQLPRRIFLFFLSFSLPPPIYGGEKKPFTRPYFGCPSFMKFASLGGTGQQLIIVGTLALMMKNSAVMIKWKLSGLRACDVDRNAVSALKAELVFVLISSFVYSDDRLQPSASPQFSYTVRHVPIYTYSLFRMSSTTWFVVYLPPRSGVTTPAARASSTAA